MLDIRKKRSISLGKDKGYVTVYRDHTDENTWYIIPEPAFAIDRDTGEIQFSLQRYRRSDTGDYAGTCSFIVELRESPDARAAVEREIPGAVIGAIDWITADAYLTYEIEGPPPEVAEARPSMEDGNRAAFVVDLPTQAAINAFVEAFKPGQAVTPFSIEYNLVTLAALDVVSVTVGYHADRAVQYAKEVKVDKNIWGKVKSRKEKIKQFLQASDAGSTDFSWKIPPAERSRELEQRVQRWAYDTLEGLVEQAIQETIDQLGEQNADQFSLSSTYDFTRTYSEDTVVEWILDPVKQLPTLTEEQWSKHFSEQDNRRLEVAFTMLQPLAGYAAESVKVEVEYPTRQTGNTHIFKAGDSAAAWVYNAPGDFATGDYNPVYKYRYTVEYGGDNAGKSYVSPWQEATATEQEINIGELGIQRVRFDSLNIDFDNQVDSVLINVVWQTALSRDQKSQEKRLTKDRTKVFFESNTFARSTDVYTFQYVYIMKDGNRIAVAPRKVDGPGNRGRVFIDTPFRPATFNLQLLNPISTDQSKPSIVQAAITAKYDDLMNGVTGLSNQWQWPSPESPSSSTAGFHILPPWTVDVIENPNGSFIEYNGYLILSTGMVQQISNLRNQTKQMLLLPGMEFWGVLFNGQKIDWKKVLQVNVDCWRVPSDSPPTLDNPGPEPSIELFKEGKQVDPGNFVFQQGLPDTTGKPFITPNQVYSFQRPANEVATYYYVATYTMLNGEDTYAEESDISRGSIVLPAEGKAEQPIVHRVVLDRSNNFHQLHLDRLSA